MYMFKTRPCRNGYKKCNTTAKTKPAALVFRLSGSIEIFGCAGCDTVEGVFCILLATARRIMYKTSQLHDFKNIFRRVLIHKEHEFLLQAVIKQLGYGIQLQGNVNR